MIEMLQGCHIAGAYFIMSSAVRRLRMLLCLFMHAHAHTHESVNSLQVQTQVCGHTQMHACQDAVHVVYSIYRMILNDTL
jgi:hypothetical protein